MAVSFTVQVDPILRAKEVVGESRNLCAMRFQCHVPSVEHVNLARLAAPACMRALRSNALLAAATSRLPGRGLLLRSWPRRTARELHQRCDAAQRVAFEGNEGGEPLASCTGPLGRRVRVSGVCAGYVRLIEWNPRVARRHGRIGGRKPIRKLSNAGAPYPGINARYAPTGS